MVGLNENEEEYNTIPIFKCKGIKFAILNYTYGLNGFKLPEDKGYLVNLEYVDGVKDGCCIIKGEALLISRARRNDFMTALTQYMGEH